MFRLVTGREFSERQRRVTREKHDGWVDKKRQLAVAASVEEARCIFWEYFADRHYVSDV